MRRISLLALVLVLLAVVIAVGCAKPAPAPAPKPSPAPAPAAPTYKWRLSQETAAMDSPSGLQSSRFSEEIKKLSNGRITVDVFPGSILGTNDFIGDQVAKGTIEFASQYASTSLDPKLDIFNVPGVGWTWKAASEIYQRPEYTAIFDKIARGVGWKVLGEVPCCFNKGVSNKKFIPVPDEVRKLNLKSRSMLMKSDELTVAALGFIATPMSFSEVSTALMTGVVDVALGPAAFDMGAFKGAIKYYYDYFYRVELTGLFMSAKLWDGLSKADQDLVNKAAAAANPLGWSEAEKVEKDYTSRLLKEFGVQEIISLTDEQNMANVKAIRDKVWPELDKTIGKDLMDMARSLATPIK